MCLDHVCVFFRLARNASAQKTSVLVPVNRCDFSEALFTFVPNQVKFDINFTVQARSVYTNGTSTCSTIYMVCRLGRMQNMIACKTESFFQDFELNK